MSAWEFTMWWSVLPLPPPSDNKKAESLSRWVDEEDDVAEEEEREFEPNPAAENMHLLFFPEIDGPVPFRRLW